jgi:hypothetical protein
VTVHRSRPGPPARKDSGALLLIPLDAEEAMLALARFRYSAERDQPARAAGEATTRSAEG